jgi:hypothetical protein
MRRTHRALRIKRLPQMQHRHTQHQPTALRIRLRAGCRAAALSAARAIHGRNHFPQRPRRVMGRRVVAVRKRPAASTISACKL